MRCLTVTLNAAVDTTYVLDSYVPGEANRISRKMAVPGGKGNNVARVLGILGHSVRASGFIAGSAGHCIEQGLKDRGIETAFVHVPGESRTCLTIIERESGAVSELLEPGVEIAPEDAEAFLRTVATLAQDVDAVVVSGSLPAGLPDDYYAQLIGVLRSSPARLVLDSSGEALRYGVLAKPDLIKPNATEMATLAGADLEVGGMVAFARQKLIGGVLAPDAQVLLSLGRSGAVLVNRDTALLASARGVSILNPVGCGDALLAGFLAALWETNDESDALAEAVTVATAAALHEIAGIVRPDDVAVLREVVQLECL